MKFERMVFQFSLLQYQDLNSDKDKSEEVPYTCVDEEEGE